MSMRHQDTRVETPQGHRWITPNMGAAYRGREASLVVIDDAGESGAVSYGYTVFAENYRSTLGAEAGPVFDALTATERQRVIDAAWRLHGKPELEGIMAKAAESIRAMGLSLASAQSSIQSAMSQLGTGLINCRCVTDVTVGDPVAIVEEIP